MSVRSRRYEMPDGLTLAEIAARTPGLPDEFWHGFGVVTINGAEIEERHWHRVRPKSPRDGQPIVVGIYIRPGKGSTILQLVASVALLAVTGFIGAGGLAGVLGAGFAAGTFGAGAAASLVSFGGQLLMSALFAPKDNNKQGREPVQAGIGGNAATPLQILPRVAGKLHMSPPYLAPPYSTLEDQDVYVEAVVGLVGNHRIEEIKLNGTDLEENEGVIDYETREGSGAALTIANKTVIDQRPNETMSAFHLDSTEGHRDELYDQTTPATSTPKWHSYMMRGRGDSARFRFLWPSGMLQQALDDAVGVAIRVQFRRLGVSAWTNGPEFHFGDRDKISQQYRQHIEFVWDEGPTFTASDRAADVDELAYIAFWNAAPGQTWEWAAHDYFDPGDGTLLADHVDKTDTGFTVYLDPDVFPKGEYEFRVKRSLGLEPAQLNLDGVSYRYNGGVNEANFFDYYDAGGGLYKVRITQKNYSTATVVESFATVDDEYPLPSQSDVPMTLIAIKCRNVSINSISATFTSRCNTWNGVDWTDFGPTQNPAALYRHFRLDDITARPLDPSVFDAAAVEDWYEHCDTQGYECAAVIAGPLDQELAKICTAGWAVPRHSDLVGVIVEKDRRAESPVQVFTPLNIANFSVEKTFADLPDALYTEFADENHDYRLTSRTVYGDGFDASSAEEFDTIRYDSISDQSQVDARALMDWRQLRYRQNRYTFDIGAEHLMCDRGDLVALAHDVMNGPYFYGLVDDVIAAGGNVTALRLEAPMELTAAAGSYNAAIRYHDGTVVEKTVSSTGTTDILAFSSAFAHPGVAVLEAGCLVTVGLASTEYRRCLVMGIERSGELRARLTLVDEAADDIHATASASLDFSAESNSQYVGMIF